VNRASRDGAGARASPSAPTVPPVPLRTPQRSGLGRAPAAGYVGAAIFAGVGPRGRGRAGEVFAATREDAAGSSWWLPRGRASAGSGRVGRGGGSCVGCGGGGSARGEGAKAVSDGVFLFFN
jgi:hypothetical protein